MKKSLVEDRAQKRFRREPMQRYNVSLRLVLVTISYRQCLIHVCIVHRLTLFALLSECSSDEAIFIRREAHKKF
jgi:hypothetical protein